MTPAPIYPATVEEFLRILDSDSERAPVLCEATVEEFLRICGPQS